MRFDIVPINKFYSGIDRSLMPDNFLTPKTKQYYDILLGFYFAYLDLMCNPTEAFNYNKKTFHIMRDFYQKFCYYNVSCELIAFNTTPLDFVYGVPVKFLGIDIVRDMAESLINYNQQPDDSVKKYLNKMGLFDNLLDVNKAIDLWGIDGSIWKPCWVYKVLV